jgi:hypothetical protein
MLSDGEAGPRVIRDQTFFGVHLPKGETSLVVIAQPFASLPEKWSFQFAGTLYLPQSIAAMRDPIELVQRTDAGEQRQFLSIQKGDA